MLLWWDVQDSPWRTYRNQFDRVLVDPQWSDTPVGFAQPTSPTILLPHTSSENPEGRLRICQNNLLFPLQTHTPCWPTHPHSRTHTHTHDPWPPQLCQPHTKFFSAGGTAFLSHPTHLSAQATGSQPFATGHSHVAVDTSWQPGALTCGTEHQNKWGSRIGMVLE